VACAVRYSVPESDESVSEMCLTARPKSQDKIQRMKIGGIESM